MGPRGAVGLSFIREGDIRKRGILFLLKGILYYKKAKIQRCKIFLLAGRQLGSVEVGSLTGVREITDRLLAAAPSLLAAGTFSFFGKRKSDISVKGELIYFCK